MNFPQEQYVIEYQLNQLVKLERITTAWRFKYFLRLNINQWEPLDLASTILHIDEKGTRTSNALSIFYTNQALIKRTATESEPEEI